MGLFDYYRKRMASPRQLLFKAQAPTEKDLRKAIGKTLWIPKYIKMDGKLKKIDSRPVKVWLVEPMKFKPKFYLLNKTHELSCLRFFAQLQGDTSISEEDFLKFEDMDVEIEKIPGGTPEKMWNEQGPKLAVDMDSLSKGELRFNEVKQLGDNDEKKQDDNDSNDLHKIPDQQKE